MYTPAPPPRPLFLSCTPVLRTELAWELRCAAAAGDLDALQRLLAAGGQGLLNQADADGFTALHRAAAAGQEEAVRALLRAGASPAAGTAAGDTPLLLAVRGRRPAVVEALLSWDVEFSYPAASTPSAANQAGVTPLAAAAAWGNNAVVQQLLASGANARAVDQEGRSPLHIAASAGHGAMVALLLQAGASAGRPARDGRTTLHFAAGAGNSCVAALLLGAPGSSAGALTLRGDTPLHTAAAAGHATFVAALLARGARLDAANNASQTALHLAAAAGHGDVVSFLLQAGGGASAVVGCLLTPPKVAIAPLCLMLAGQGDSPPSAWSPHTNVFCIATPTGHLSAGQQRRDGAARCFQELHPPPLRRFLRLRRSAAGGGVRAGRRQLRGRHAAGAGRGGWRGRRAAALHAAPRAAPRGGRQRDRPRCALAVPCHGGIAVAGANAAQAGFNSALDSLWLLRSCCHCWACRAWPRLGGAPPAAPQRWELRLLRPAGCNARGRGGGGLQAQQDREHHHHGPLSCG